MGNSERIWDGERYAVTRFWGHQAMPELKIWDKIQERHIWSRNIIPENDLTPGNEKQIKKVALNKAKALDEEYVMGAAS